MAAITSAKSPDPAAASESSKSAAAGAGDLAPSRWQHVSLHGDLPLLDALVTAFRVADADEALDDGMALGLGVPENGPNQTLELRVPDPGQFKLVKVGDQMQSAYTEALALSVEPAARTAPTAPTAPAKKQAVVRRTSLALILTGLAGCTRLPSQWRQTGFDPKLSERTPSPQNELAASVLCCSLALKKAYPLPDVKVLDKRERKALAQGTGPGLCLTRRFALGLT